MSVLVPLDRIQDSPYQTRTHYDEAEIIQLAASIKQDGLIQVPVGRLINAQGKGLGLNARTQATYRRSVVQVSISLTLAEENWHVQVAVGHRRYRALQRLGWKEVPVELRPLSDEQMDMLAWHENHDRSDLSPIEEAVAIQARIERHGWTQAQAGGALGLSVPAISNKLRLLKLPAEIQEHLAAGRLSERSASSLLPLYQAEGELAEIIARLPVRSTILSEALEGASSNVTREQVAQAVRTAEGILERERKQLRLELPEPQPSPEKPRVIREAEEAIGMTGEEMAAAAERSRQVREEGPPAEDEGHFIAVDPDGRTIWGIGRSEQEARLDANDHSPPGTIRFMKFIPCAVDLHNAVLEEGGFNLAWYVGADGVAQLGAAQADPLEAVRQDPDPETRRAMEERAEGRHVFSKAEIVAASAEQEGAEACRSGRLPSDRPYDGGTPEGDAWEAGYWNELKRLNGWPPEPQEVPAPAWPELRYDPVYAQLPKMTKGQLSDVYDRFRNALHRSRSGQWYASAKKDEMLQHVQGLVRFHACLEAVNLLSDEQAAELLAWLQKECRERGVPEEQRQANWELESLREAEKLGIMSEPALERYRLIEARRAGAFCYHLFLAAILEECQRQADYDLDGVHPEELQVYAAGPADGEDPDLFEQPAGSSPPETTPAEAASEAGGLPAAEPAESSPLPALSDLERRVLAVVAACKIGIDGEGQALHKQLSAKLASSDEMGAVPRLVGLGYLDRVTIKPSGDKGVRVTPAGRAYLASTIGAPPETGGDGSETPEPAVAPSGARHLHRRLKESTYWVESTKPHLASRELREETLAELAEL